MGIRSVPAADRRTQSFPRSSLAASGKAAIFDATWNKVSERRTDAAPAGWFNQPAICHIGLVFGCILTVGFLNGWFHPF